MLRNHKWLENQLDLLLRKYFGDISITTPIEIQFGREAKYRFGSIKLYRNKKQDVPVKVVAYTIAHELCHYAHGFSSTNRRLFKFPHHGGIVNAELQKRGANDLITAYKKWLKTYRQTVLKGKISV